MTVVAHIGGELSGAGQTALVTGTLLLVAWLDRSGRATGVLPHRRRLSLWAAVVTGLTVTVGPVAVLAHRSFAVHMVQHLVLLLVVAPLLVVARPDLVLLRALSGGARRRTALRGRAITPRWPAGPVLAGLLLAAWLWIAHAPSVYDAQLASPWIHLAEHAVWVAAGIAFWAPLLRQRPTTARRVLTPLLELVVLMPASTILALVLSGAGPRFAHYAGVGDAVGDQRLGAAVMWGTMMVVLLGTALVVIGTSEPRRGTPAGRSRTGQLARNSSTTERKAAGFSR